MNEINEWERMNENKLMNKTKYAWKKNENERMKMNEHDGMK